MRKMMFLLAPLFCLTLLVGCPDDTKNKPKDKAKDAADKAKVAADKAKEAADKAKEAADKAKDAADDAAKALKKQKEFAQPMHQQVLEGKATCIDCHKGVGHVAPTE